jgi:hypothetical protein
VGNEPSRDRPAERTAPGKVKRDYIAIFAGPLTAAIATFAVALVGIFGNQAIRLSSEAAAARATQEQNYRLYTEMINQREQAESALRKDVLARILSDFFNEADKNDIEKSLRARLLKLELLSLNFGESLSLSPLFGEMADGIDVADLGAFGELKKEYLNGRLRSLAHRVADRQLSALSAGGATFQFSLPVSDVSGQRPYVWPDDLVEANRILIGKDEEWASQERIRLARLTVGNVSRDYRIEMSRADPERETVAVVLHITDVVDGDGAQAIEPIKMSFTLDQFNFPMIDSTRLLPDQRFALVMQNFDTLSITFVGICYPGIYAGQRDKPFLNEVIEQLRSAVGSELVGSMPEFRSEGTADVQSDSD